MSKKTVDNALYNLVFAGLSIEKMDKLPKWLLENMEKNKEPFKAELAQLLLEEMPEKRADRTVGGDKIELSEFGQGINQAIDQVTDKIKAIFGVGDDVPTDSSSR